MSIKVMSAIWDRAGADGTMLVLLLALGDYSNDAGVCWPSITTLARRIRRTPRQTYRLLEEAEALGLLARDSGGKRGEPKRSNRYQLQLPTPDMHVTGDANVTGDTNDTGTPDMRVTPPLTPMSPKPSMNRHGNRQSPPNPPRGGRKRTPVRFSEPGSYQ